MYGSRTVMAPRGMVTSPHYLATSAGLQVLENGGNAIEAAIAVASVIAVVYPHMNGIGGDNFWLIYDAKRRQVKSLQACGPAGSLCTPQLYADRGHPNAIPFRGVLAANTVPGAVDGWSEAYRFSRDKLGGSIEFPVLLQQAIFYAEFGYPVSYGQHVWTLHNVGPDSGALGHLEDFDGFARTFLKSSGQAYLSGERFKIPELAHSLRSIAEGGSEAFYRGPIAEQICAYLSERGGLLTLSDFASYHSRWDDPISTQYRHWKVYNSPPPTQGLTSLQILRIIENFPIADWGDDSSLYYHVIVEATKEAFRDRDTWIGDPNFKDVPVERLLSKKYTKKLATSIDLSVAKSNVVTEPGGGDTVWMGIVDKDGNAVSLIQSTYFDFGSGVVVDGTGITLQNRGASFSLNNDSVNLIAPGKRPFHTLNPAMALRDGSPELVYGTMGGEGQPQTQAAILTRILDLGMNVQAAIDAPRWLFGRTWGDETSTLSVEGRLSNDIVESLLAKGHDVHVVGDWDERMGHAQAIWIDPNSGMMHGGADTRGDGLAAGY